MMHSVKMDYSDTLCSDLERYHNLDAVDELVTLFREQLLTQLHFQNLLTLKQREKWDSLLKSLRLDELK